MKGQWPEGSRELRHVRTLVEGVGVLAVGLTVADRTEVLFTALARDTKFARNAVESTRQLLTFASKELIAEAKDGQPTQAVKLLAEALEKAEIVRAGPHIPGADRCGVQRAERVGHRVAARVSAGSLKVLEQSFRM